MGLLVEQQKNWKICLRDRSALLESHSIYDYFQLFPILRTQFGYELLLQDFNRIYAAQKDALYTAWDVLSRAITSLSIQRKDLPSEIGNNPNRVEGLINLLHRITFLVFVL